MKKVRSSEYLHREADSFARYALNAKCKGDAGRAVIFYEIALNFELEAINTFTDETTAPTKVLGFYRNAVSYALECGRKNKAKHLIESALSQNPSPEMVVVFEDLLSRV